MRGIDGNGVAVGEMVEPDTLRDDIGGGVSIGGINVGLGGAG